MSMYSRIDEPRQKSIETINEEDRKHNMVIQASVEAKRKELKDSANYNNEGGSIYG